MQMPEHDFYSAPEIGQLPDQGQVYSTLEIGQQPDRPQVYSTLESRRPDFSLFDTYKQSTTATPQPQILDDLSETPNRLDNNNDNALASKDRGPRKRARRILVGLGILFIIAAAVIGGGVGGTSHRSIRSVASNDRAPPSKVTNISSSSSSYLSISSGASISTTSTASSFPTPTAKLNTTLHNGTNLASLVWDLNGVTQYRVWYQTEDNMIREVGKNDTGNQWYISGQSHGPAKNASPIAASYTGPPDWGIEIDLFYIADDGSIIFTRFGQKDQTWTTSTLSEIPANGSNLATLWFRHNQCNGCSNDLLLVCQNSDDKLALFNSTASAGPQWITLDANPVAGTGLALNLVPGANDTGNLLISYQTANEGLCLANFNEAQGWTVSEGSPISQLSTQAPIAGFTWNVSDADNLDILSTGPGGITVSYLNITTGDWSTVNPEVLAQVQNYSAIAANDASHVYALQDGNVKEFQLAPDGVTWSYVGDVDTF